VGAVRDFLGYLARRGASSNTIAAYRSDLEQFAYFVETNEARGGFSALDRPAIDRFVAGLKESGYRDVDGAQAGGRTLLLRLSRD